MQKELNNEAMVKLMRLNTAIVNMSTEYGTTANLKDMSSNTTNLILPTNATTIASQIITQVINATTNTGMSGIQKAMSSFSWIKSSALATIPGNSLSNKCNWWTVVMYCLVVLRVSSSIMATIGSWRHSRASAVIDASSSMHFLSTRRPSRFKRFAFDIIMSRSEWTRDMVSRQFLSRTTTTLTMSSTRRTTQNISARARGLL
mmetsp:Transcript_23307/g.66831  ORF Transcript_23307/g.66831 Transcript_23307/m.66831 type:complete len:203 (+) Transcript_23307:830-1438(+)